MNKSAAKYSDLELSEMLLKEKHLAETAFAEIYLRYSQRIYAYCLRVTGYPDDAKDIFQDVFLKFHDSALKKGSIDNIMAYLLVIARNHCLNYKRNMKSNVSIEDFDFSTNDSGYEQKELLDLIAKALDCLEFEYKEAFILRQYHGLSYKEIEDITGASMSAVKNRVWRAKEKIKEILQPYLQDLSKINDR